MSDSKIAKSVEKQKSKKNLDINFFFYKKEGKNQIPAKKFYKKYNLTIFKNFFLFK